MISSLNNPDYYVYNDSKDTLQLTTIEVGKIIWRKSSIIVDTIQIDGIGSKEVLFARDYLGHTCDIKQVTQTLENTKIHKYEIWNIDTKTLLFEAIDKYEFNYNNWSHLSTLRTEDSSSQNYLNKGKCSYKYEFSIDKNGQIIIDKIKYEKINNNCLADKKEGIYKFSNGKYTI